MWVDHRTSPVLPMPSGFVWAVPFLQKYWRAYLGLPDKTIILWGFLDMLCGVLFFLTSVSYLPCGSEVNVPFYFSKIFLLSFLFLFLGKPFLGLVLGKMSFPYWGNHGWIISLYGVKGLHWWSKLLIPTEPSSIDGNYPFSATAK